jgi:hypothetical protein
MADRYVSSLAAGGGSGTSGSPWTFAEAIAGASSSDKIWVKADGDYAVTVTNTNNSLNRITVEGYGTTTGDSVKATLKISASVTAISSTQQEWCFKNLIVDGQGNTGARFLDSHPFSLTYHGFYNCEIINFSSTPIRFRGGRIKSCYFENCVGFDGGDGGSLACVDSVFDGCTGAMIPFKLLGEGGGMVSGCKFLNHGAATSGIVVCSNAASIKNCLFHFATKNTNDVAVHWDGGFGGPRQFLIGVDDCLFVNCGNAVAMNNDKSVNGIVQCCAFYNVTNQKKNSEWSLISPVSLSADPFVDAANGDFHLTETARDTMFSAGFNIPSKWLAALSGGGGVPARFGGWNGGFND